jgi:hypothetical protein
VRYAQKVRRVPLDRCFNRREECILNKYMHNSSDILSG